MSTAEVAETEPQERVSEAVKSDAATRAVSLLGVLVFAKILTLVGRDIAFSGWAPVAYLWQDVLFVLLLTTLDHVVRRSWFGWTLYVVAVAFAAINVPLVRVMSTSLTWPMLRAAGGTLADSIAHYVTWTNGLSIGAVIVLAAVLPRLTRGLTCQLTRRLRVTVVAALTVVCLGPLAVARIDTFGLHRNYVLALVTTAVPRVGAQAANYDWRRSPFPQASRESLADLHGIAADHNVVLIILESAGAQYLKPYGAAEDPMPHLTALSQRAVLFEQAYTVYPESIKGLVAVLSSISPALDTKAEQYETIGTQSLATDLREAGYRTGLFHSGRFMYLGMESVIRDRGYDTLEDVGHISGVHFSSFGVDEPSTVKRMLAWIDQEPADQRFFVTYMPVAGHHPYDSPEPGPFPGHDDIGRYRNALHYADAAVDQLVQGLKQRGLDENTLIVIVGDHGQAFGQHEGNFGHTFFLYDENVRVPLMFVFPNLERPLRVGRVVSTLDVAPTVLELLGREPPRKFQGRSMLAPGPRMALFFTDYSQALLGLRDGRWKFIQTLDSGRSRLFDLETDPGERHNLAEQHAARVEIYADQLHRWTAATRAFVLARN